MSNIIKFIDNDSLDKEIDKLRIEISMKILERDTILFSENKNIEASYMSKFGEREIKLFDAEMKYLRIKRKLALIILARNHNQSINLLKIEKILDNEFDDYNREKDELLDKLSNSIKYLQGSFLSEDENKKIKKIYREIVKKLHPDLHPNLTQAEKNLFFTAVQSYENGSITMLEAILGSIGSDEKDFKQTKYAEKQHLEKVLIKIQKEIDEIKENYPYTLKEILTNDKKRTEHRKKLDEELHFFEEGIAKYKIEIKEYL